MIASRARPLCQDTYALKFLAGFVLGSWRERVVIDSEPALIVGGAGGGGGAGRSSRKFLTATAPTLSSILAGDVCSRSTDTCLLHRRSYYTSYPSQLSTIHNAHFQLKHNQHLSGRHAPFIYRETTCDIRLGGGQRSTVHLKVRSGGETSLQN